MGRVLISGAGHSGTNLATQLVVATQKFNFTYMVEDRMFFVRKDLPPGYATKLAVENDGFTVTNISKVLDRFEDLKIIFSLRHPVDRCLSHIYRGRPASVGGDSWEEVFDPNATFVNSPLNLRYMVMLLLRIEDIFADRVLRMPMELIITDVRKAANLICEFLDVSFTDAMLEPWKFCRHRFIAARYPNRLCSSQVDMYKRWDTIFDGYYRDKYDEVRKLCVELGDVASILGYKMDEI